MNSIKFIPKEFNEVNLGYFEGGSTLCTPAGTDFLWSQIVINVPRKIICSISDITTFTPVIPVCGRYVITQLRILRYIHLTRMFHIKKIGTEIWKSGEIVAPFLDNEILPPDHEEMERERQTRIKEAQNLTDEEIDRRGGQAVGRLINLNLMEYVDIPFEPGIYEIYMSFRGLESNRATVEIIFKEEKK
jgi:hypothetical protein